MNTRTLGIVALLVVLIGGAYWMLSSSDTADSLPSTKEFILKVENKKLVSGPAAIIANQNDTVTIKITSDVDEELHLHGYDKSVDLEAGKEAELTFIANASGHFPYELEHSKTEIGALDVLP